MPSSGFQTDDQINAFIAQARIPLRLAVLDGTGCPIVLSLWFLQEDGAFWCATKADAQVIRYLTARPRCGFEIAGDTPPYRGVRGKGTATLHPERGAEILERLLDRYAILPGSRLASMLLAKADQEVAIRIVPQRLSSWDFSRRMKDSVAPAN